jgi:N-acylneuraminate cytidylyltransferase
MLATAGVVAAAREGMALVDGEELREAIEIAAEAVDRFGHLLGGWDVSVLPARLDAVVLDFDGVFTDNRVWVFEDGREAVACYRSDGLGMERVRVAGWPILVLSKERNPVVSARCAKLKLECLQGVDDKRGVLEGWCRERGFLLSNVIYLGNDVNDVPCLEVVGCPAVVADAYPEAVGLAKLVLRSRGGYGALRELSDMIVARYGSGGPAG